MHVHSYSTIHEAVILPYAQIGRHVRLNKVVIDSEVSIPDGLVVGEDPVLDAKRFRRTESGVTLITGPMIEKLEAMSGSEGPVGRLGGLSARSRPAASPTSPARCPARSCARTSRCGR